MKYTLVFLMIFLGIGGLFGGGLLILDPSGNLLGTPISMLENSPFQSFLIPGIILFSLFGVLSFITGVALLKKPKSKLAEKLNCFRDKHWSWTYTIYIALALIIWIQIQEIIISSVHWLHSFYMLWAVLIVFTALQSNLRSRYNRKKFK